MRCLGSHEVVLSEALEPRRLLASAITGVIWKDVDQDSHHDPAEPGVTGLRVYADYNNNSRMDSGEASTLSGRSGVFRIAAVKPGTFPVRVQLGSGWNQSFPFKNYGRWVTLKSSDVGAIEFGVYPRSGTGAVNGRLFHDINDDAVQNADEPGLGNRTVFVDVDNDRKLDANEPRALSLGDGRFQINGVPAGTSLAVRQILPEFWEQTFPVATTYAGSPSVGWAARVNVSPGKIAMNALFGSHRMDGWGVVVGRALLDADGDGKFEAPDNAYRNPAITGVGIWVDYNNDGKRNDDEPCPVYTDIEQPGWGVALPNSAGLEEACFQIRYINIGRWPVRMSLMAGWKAISTTVRWVTILPEKTLQVSDFLAQPVGTFGSITSSIFRDGNHDGNNNDGPGGGGVPVNGPMLFIDLDRVNNDFSMPEFNDPVQNLRYFSELGDSTTVGIVDLPPGKYRLRCSLPYRGETAFWVNTTGTGAGFEVKVNAGRETTVSPGFGLYLDTSFP